MSSRWGCRNSKALNFCLLKSDEIKIAGGEPTGLGPGGMAGESFERLAPGVGEAAGLGLADKGRGEAPGGDQAGACRGVVGDGVKGDRMVKREGGISGASEGAGFCGRLPVGRLAHSEAAQIVESDLGRGVPLEFSAALRIEVA